MCIFEFLHILPHTGADLAQVPKPALYSLEALGTRSGEYDFPWLISSTMAIVQHILMKNIFSNLFLILPSKPV